MSQFSINPNWYDIAPTSTRKPNLIQRCFNTFFCRQTSSGERQKKFTKDYILNNLSRIIIWMIYILINLALIIYVIIYRAYQQKAYVFVVIARIGGILLDFNCALVIALMLKRTILIMRSTKILRKFLPIDDHIDFHRIVGRFIGVLAIVHTAGHIANFIHLDKSGMQPRKKLSLIYYLYALNYVYFYFRLCFLGVFSKFRQLCQSVQRSHFLSFYVGLYSVLFIVIN